MSARLVRPATTLVQEPSIATHNGRHHQQEQAATTYRNGPTRAAGEVFPPEPMICDPQMDEPVSLGTTIMAVSYEGGVVLAADSRTSTGTIVVDRAANKLTKLSGKIYCCRSGSAADTQALAQITSNYLEQHRIDIGKDPNVKAASGLFQRLVYNNRWNISAGIIVAGWDELNGGSVYSIPSGGSCVKLDYALGGSGSIFLYSYMDKNYKLGMTKDECVTFCKEAAAHALSRDGSSGGVVRTIALGAGEPEHSTTPWTAIPYCMERDPQYQTLAAQNQPVTSSGKDVANKTHTV